MIIEQFGTRTAVSVTTSPTVLPYDFCGGQGIWCYNPSTNTEEVVFAIASSTAVASAIGELLPGEADTLPVRANGDADQVYVYTRSGTATLSVGGVA